MFVLALARSCRLFLDCNHDQNAISYELVFQGTQETRYDRGEYSDKFQNGRMWFEDRHTDWGAVQRSAGFYKYEPHEFVSVLRLVMMIYEKAKFGSSPGYRFGTGESFTVLLNFQLCISKMALIMHHPFPSKALTPAFVSTSCSKNMQCKVLIRKVRVFICIAV
ncbi:hypothetical protein M758_5G189000 [Ceratodon purpureus]|uniref:Uncharacterized protein n=1 Tax=Ceratodon purpureus TaxID=3225 RepID=A0A8T0I632_CERPU|nr:hypothetical protein KC19_5G196000 [Ceratodon purpureus]KAG0617424.1 hypothetical protein M758_5G189000 [Ceratodon purpureus]